MSWEYLYHFVRSDAKSDYYIYGNRPPAKYPEKRKLWEEVPDKFRRGVWHKKDIPKKYLPVMRRLDYYANLDAVRLPPQIFENRPMGVVRQRLYPESKYNKFNYYRVRDAEKKKGQPQFKASQKEIEEYKKQVGKYA